MPRVHVTRSKTRGHPYKFQELGPQERRRRPARPPKNTDKERYEILRRNNVPRFLFRAFHSNSCGGPGVSTNNAEKTVPPAFQAGTAPKSFYDMTVEEMRAIAHMHYAGGRQPLTVFSSWTHSMHLAVHYAESFKRRGCKDVQIACMDRFRMGTNVTVFHVPHLLQSSDCGEYLAFGVIKGRGYKSVLLEDMEKSGLESIGGFVAPDPSKPYHQDSFGSALRRAAFSSRTLSPVTAKIMGHVTLVADLFGPTMSTPVALALLTMQRRFWGPTPPADLLDRCVNLRTWAFKSNEYEQWLVHGNVATREFEDVKQWIYLYRAVADRLSVGRGKHRVSL